MARPKKVVVEEAQVEEVVEQVALVEEPAEKTFTVTLEGRVGGYLDYAINGRLSKLPTGIEICLNEQTYNAVSAYIKNERN